MTPYNKIVISGPSSAGKTTLGRRLSAICGITHIELDALHWEPGWTPAQPEVFRERVRQALDRPAWIVDGNYRVIRDLTWGQAELMIWLDYPLPLLLWRLTARTFRRRFRNQELWNGNREKLRMFFFSRESLYLWVLKTHRRHRREYPAQFANMPNLHVARVRSPRELERLLRDLTPRLPRLS